MPANIAFMETAEWWRGDQITSVRPLVQILAQIENKNPSYFPYSTFVDSQSFQATLSHFQDTHGIRHVHIGCHGSHNGLVIDNEEIIPELISDQIQSETIRGLLISACTSEEMAQQVVENVLNYRQQLNGKNIWVAGYRTEVDWLDSTTFEILFWRKVIQNRNLTRGPQIRGSLLALKNDGYEKVMNELGFCVYYRENGAIHDLLNQPWFIQHE